MTIIKRIHKGVQKALDAIDRYIAWVKSWATKSGRRGKKINKQIDQMKANGTRIVVKRKRSKGTMTVNYYLETKAKSSVHTQKISRTLAQFYVRKGLKVKHS